MRRPAFAILFTVLFLSSCSFFRIGLRYFEWFIVRDVSSRFDLNHSQKREFKEFVKVQTPRLREYWVPRVIEKMSEFELKSKLRLKAGEIEEFVEAVKAIRTDYIYDLAPDLSKFMTALGSDQIANAQKEFVKSNERLTDLNALTDDRLERKRSEKLFDSAEDWYGPLTVDQKAMVCKVFGCKRSDILNALKWTESWQRNFIESLNHWKTFTNGAEILRNWSQFGMTESQFKQEWDMRQLQIFQGIAELDGMMTPVQIETSRKKFTEYRDDLAWFSKAK